MRVWVVLFALVAGLLAGCEDEPEGQKGPNTKPEPALAARFAPLVFLANGESHLPMDATEYARQSSLWFADARCDDVEVAGRVEPQKLGKGPDLYRSSRCTSVAVNDTDFPAEDTGFFLRPPESTRTGQGVGAPAYWEYHEHEGKAAYLYWFFYGYNKSVNVHEGDWERIAVQVQGGKPTAVTFYGHGRTPCALPWESQQLAKIDDHPQIYSAKGSHASYPDTANLSYDRRSAGTQWNTWERLLPVEQEPWFGYRGWWGPQSWIPFNGFNGPMGPYPQRGLNVFPEKQCDEKEPEITAQLPQAFEGEWETRDPATQKPESKPYHMRVSLAKDKSTVRYRTTWTDSNPKLACDGTWAATAATDKFVQMHEQIVTTSAGDCVPEGTVNLTPDGDALKVVVRGGRITMTAKLYKRTEPANEQAGALERFEEYLHAVGNENLDVVCEIAGPGAKKAEQKGFGPCRTTMPIMFKMFSPQQKAALRTATVDKSQVIEKPGVVEVPATAVRAGSVKFTSSNLGDYTMTLMNGKWFVTD
ncbi:hypothetical protein LWC34_47130 [Kibdelosporangium philippinense]|uniref:DUF946 domain-containing protein n=2 Tax=Kibdelosporangium philippinense TaxID=211113 RepID=A0ABS8ZRW6_9PSEU|nr:hypothetical protein [Kibdelosporangium philippinense]MCE7010329.1 hypothetical protein [Kibdelosporangium philippinense]